MCCLFAPAALWPAGPTAWQCSADNKLKLPSKRMRPLELSFRKDTAEPCGHGPGKYTYSNAVVRIDRTVWKSWRQIWGIWTCCGPCRQQWRQGPEWSLQSRHSICQLLGRPSKGICHHIAAWDVAETSSFGTPSQNDRPTTFSKCTCVCSKFGKQHGWLADELQASGQSFQTIPCVSANAASFLLNHFLPKHVAFKDIK